MISNCQKYLAIRLTFICVIVLYRSLGDRQFRMHGLGRNSSADPFHLVVGFQRFRNALSICHLLYQPKKKRRLEITPKTALFCCGSERTFYGEAAAEEIGVRPIPVWWRWRESNPRPKTGYRGFLRV